MASYTNTTSVVPIDEDRFRCAITTELMRDPVQAGDGYSYDYEAIMMWFDTEENIHNPTVNSPRTNAPMTTQISCASYSPTTQPRYAR
jgi:hypothetical protein